jgi:TnpA family transposase
VAGAGDGGDGSPVLKEHIRSPVNAAPVLECWDDILHLAPTANPARLAKALLEPGRIKRTLFMRSAFGHIVLKGVRSRDRKVAR